MANWFYTDSAAAQQGPVSEDELLDLNRNGEISAKSLVWTEGMEDWVPFLSIAPSLFGEDDEGIPIRVGVCAFSSRVFPMDELIPYGEALVGVEFKDAFVQRLMEKGMVDVPDATRNPLEYVGFWWRTLSSFLDSLVKIIPGWICMTPYYVVVFSNSAALEDSPEDLGLGFTLAMAISYGVGCLGVLAVSIFYETWMVGRFQGTLGKLVIGSKVVRPDGTRLTYKAAFFRWLAKKPLNYMIVWGPSTVGFAVIIGFSSAVTRTGDAAASTALSMMTGLVIYVGLLVLGSAVYWMAAFDEEKRALHDRVSGTRVIKK